MSTKLQLGDLARRVGGIVRGDAMRWIHGLATLEDAGPEHLSFLTNPRYREAARTTRAGAVLSAPGSGLSTCDLLETAAPQVALAELLELFHPALRPPHGVSPDARVAADVELGPGVSIGPFVVIGAGARIGAGVVLGAGCVVGEGCTIGARTELKPRVVVYPGTVIGARCLIHAGAVLGSDGFGFVPENGRHRKLQQVGLLVVEDDVEIGANSAIDRATLGATRVGEGTKIDNLVQVGHGVRIGAHGLLAGQAGIAGSTRLGRNATLAGQVGVAGHLELGDGAVVAAKSAVFQDVAAGAIVAGIPAVDHRRWKRSQALLQRLPRLQRELRELQRRLAVLERGQREEG